MPLAFLSYSHADIEFAETLAEDLKTAGANVWMDELELEHGIPWDSAIEIALNNCVLMVVILSANSSTSQNVLDEVYSVLAMGKRVIPLLYRDCNVPYRLRRIQYIDFRTNYVLALRKLAKDLGVK
jgi:hypothetical protein